jgi:hypothetical protein
MKYHYITLSDYLRYEKEAEKNSVLRCEELLKLYKLTFNAFSKTIQFLTKNSDFTDMKSNQFIIITAMYRLIGTLQSIRILVLKGYYYEANVLTRTIWESLGFCAYLKDNPEKSNQIFEHKKLDISSIGLFKYNLRIFGMQRNEEQEKLTNKMYGEFCDYVHGNLNATLKGISANFDHLITKDAHGSEFATMTMTLPSDLDTAQVLDLLTLPTFAIIGLRYCFDDSLSQEQKRRLQRIIVDGIKKIANYKERLNAEKIQDEKLG